MYVGLIRKQTINYSIIISPSDLPGYVGLNTTGNECSTNCPTIPGGKGKTLPTLTHSLTASVYAYNLPSPLFFSSLLRLMEC